MLLLESLAEQKIQEAIERGELDGLPGSGRPLELNDDPLVPEELRIVYRVLKNAGFVPPEVELRREIHAAERAFQDMQPGPDRTRALRRLQLLNMKLAESRPGGHSLRVPPKYYQKLVEKLG